MNVILLLAFLFIIGAVVGWVIELFFRRFFSANNPERKWINPGFCVGPYLPLYGIGLCVLFLLSLLGNLPLCPTPFWNKALILIIMAVSMTLIEYVTGIFCLRVLKVRLWDYSGCKGNIQGIICPLFSFVWALIAVVYYFLIHPLMVDMIIWLERNLAFSFLIGLFFGVFLVDVVYSSQLIAKIKAYAVKNQVVVRYEALKVQVRQRQDELRKKQPFFFPLRTELSLPELLKELHKLIEKQKSHLEAIRKKRD